MYCFTFGFVYRNRFKGATLLLTFMAYTCYHMNRKPISVFKNVINRNCSNLVPPPGQDIDPSDDTWCDWAPFGKVSTQRPTKSKFLSVF